ncbi:MAG: TIGR03087 family PEP-CTERM/XrtA system glycosyltransferase [Planctomycetota bacterium]|jgi:sugar transferase (PEP-CTERM/EpsH1 system associated)
MNILYLAHRIPFPPNKGDKLRSFRQLRQLAKRHKVWCAYFVDDPSDAQYVGELGPYCHRQFACPLPRTISRLKGLIGILRGRTATESIYSCRAMRRTLKAWQRETSFDSVATFSSAMAPYALRVPSARKTLDLCDLDSFKWMDYARHSKGILGKALQLEGTRLAQRERQWINAFDASMLITANEAKLVEPESLRGKIHVVGNGVEVPEPAPVRREAAHPIVGFVGVMDYRPNIDAVTWFARNCWPAIRTMFPNAEFRIVGRAPTRDIRDLVEMDGVTVTGEVPSIGRELAEFRVSVAPLRIARGLQNKVLEAMAASVPVVLTSAAAEGIDASDGHEFLIADSAEDMVKRVLDLVPDHDRRQRIGMSGREFVKRENQWTPLLEKYETIVTGLAAEVTRDRSAVRGHQTSESPGRATPDALPAPAMRCQ